MSYFENTDKIDQWYQIRRSRFTSSENYKLLLTDGVKNYFAPGGKIYIESKVIELTTKMWQRPELEEVESLLHGKIYELPAYERYVLETKNHSMVYMGTENPVFIEDENIVDEAGGTPDVANITNTNSIDYLCEVKCPKNPAYHFRRLKWKDQWDIKENYISCYTQMQDLIRITGAFGCDFVSYDERQLAKSKQIKIIQVKPDQKFIDNLEIRIKTAVKEKYKLLSEHMGTELKNRASYLEFVNKQR